jgi:hypothetical protein
MKMPINPHIFYTGEYASALFKIVRLLLQTLFAFSSKNGGGE